MEIGTGKLSKSEDQNGDMVRGNCSFRPTVFQIFNVDIICLG